MSAGATERLLRPGLRALEGAIRGETGRPVELALEIDFNTDQMLLSAYCDDTKALVRRVILTRQEIEDRTYPGCFAARVWAIAQEALGGPMSRAREN